MTRKHLTSLVFFALLLALSLSFLWYAYYLSSDAALPPGGGTARPPIEQNPLPLILSGVTAVISVAGFITTTLFAYREDRRESERHHLQLEKLRRELQQKEMEIERLHQRLAPPRDDPPT